MYFFSPYIRMGLIVFFSKQKLMTIIYQKKKKKNHTKISCQVYLDQESLDDIKRLHLRITVQLLKY